MDKKNFLILLFSTVIAAFVGAFSASYIVLGPQKQTIVPETEMNNNEQVEQIIKHQQEIAKLMDNDAEDFMNQPLMPADFAIFGNNIFNSGNVTTIKTEETKKAYIIKIDLDPFDDDAKNVHVKVNGNKVVISAQYKSKNKNEFKSSQFYQSLTLPEKIDSKSVKQEKQVDSLVITIPKIK